MTDNVIIFGSAKEAKTYKPSKPTIMFGLCDLVEEAVLVPKEVALNNRVNEYHKVPFKVLKPTGPEGSFKDMDDQAKTTGQYLKKAIKEGFDIFIHCEYGEIRSHMVALGLYLGFSGDRGLFECIHGNLAVSERSTNCTQGRRTSSWIGDIIQSERVN